MDLNTELPGAGWQGPVPPPYKAACERSGCNAPAHMAIVLHAWPAHLAGVFRGVHNSTKLFPDVVACKGHAHSLSEIGTHVISQALDKIREHFKSLSLGPPDLKGLLIEAVPVDEAMKMWRNEKTPEH